MSESKEVIRLIETYLNEMEVSGVAPTLITMNIKHYNSLKKDCPYLISGMYYVTERDKIKIVLTDENIVSVGLCFFSEIDSGLENGKASSY
jgi:hypothetical protein